MLTFDVVIDLNSDSRAYGPLRRRSSELRSEQRPQAFGNPALSTHRDAE
jgi:hypothetical protein